MNIKFYCFMLKQYANSIYFFLFLGMSTLPVNWFMTIPANNDHIKLRI